MKTHKYPMSRLEVRSEGKPEKLLGYVFVDSKDCVAGKVLRAVVGWGSNYWTLQEEPPRVRKHDFEIKYVNFPGKAPHLAVCMPFEYEARIDEWLKGYGFEAA